MRRTGHLRERSLGSFEIRYSLGTDPATGKRKMRPRRSAAAAKMLRKNFGVCCVPSISTSTSIQPDDCEAMAR